MEFGNAKRVKFKLNHVEKQSTLSINNGTGTVGSFNRIRNDFSPPFVDYEPSDYWNESFTASEYRGKIKRFRFVICTLSLLALSLCFMSRVIFNVAVTAMVRKTSPVDNVIEMTTNTVIASSEVETVITTESEIPPHLQAGEEDGTHLFDWSQNQQNLLVASYYIGYAPCMLISGGLADKYGSKLLMFVSVFSCFLVSMLTPFIASMSYSLLVASRIFIGLLQGGLIPASYDLFRRWLTLPETSIFAPLIKVSIAVGGFVGSSLPGLISKLGYDWPAMFYAGGVICAVWSLIWLPLATNSPQTNRFVRRDDMEKVKRRQDEEALAATSASNSISIVLTNEEGIERERKTTRLESNPTSFVRSKQSTAEKRQQVKDKPKAVAQNEEQIPWLLIICHPSVLSLAIVKLTYNFTMDFLLLLLPFYLKQIHDASLITISMIAGSANLMQMTLITFVAWLAKVVVLKRTFNLSTTKWRKIFQGTSNLSMAFLYLLFPFVESLFAVSCLVVLIAFFWMLGAGGESMVPYDLSHRYPATIMGLAHSFSILSGIFLPALSSLILGNDASNPVLWNKLFVLLGGAVALGGIVFILVHKSKPFLPGEREEKK